MKCKFMCCEKTEALMQTAADKAKKVVIVKLIPITGQDGIVAQGGFQITLTDPQIVAEYVVGQEYNIRVNPVVETAKSRIIVPR